MSEQNFRFYPRPEAHSMKWGELLPPLRRAVRDLLIRLDGAITKVDESMTGLNKENGDEVTANCFLVHGERGTGKSTVLLSARTAVCKKCKGFFESVDEDDSLGNETTKCADNLKAKGIVWLDVLDLESLTLHANLLTTMLTRLRNALCSSEIEKSFELTSILEEDAKSARHKLKQLINDATLMWEDIDEPDTRNKANRQIAAADIYAHFRERFKDAMDTLSKELGRRNGMNNINLHIVLPIDNIDRSTDHLHSIIKLAQMVAHPHLWLVLAGDREDIETFLERAFWKELISIGEGGGGSGKTGLCGEDEALVMARRQAAAASHKLLPPSHRIEVGLVNPEDTLNFPVTSIKDSNEADVIQIKCIYDLLKLVEIPNLGNGPKISFIELFDARKRVDGFIGLPHFDKRYLTKAAQLALKLPARGVLDLWQLAHGVVNDKAQFLNDTAKAENGNYFLDAEKIARTMLRNVIAESKLSSKMSQYLQSKVIQLDTDGATILNFYEPNKQYNPCLKVNRMSSIDISCRIYLYTSQPGKINNEIEYNIRSNISLFRKKEVLMLVIKIVKNINTYASSELSDIISGWLLVLHDIVAQSEKSWILEPLDYRIRLAQVSHGVVCNADRKFLKDEKFLWWPAPLPINFITYDVFSLKWEKLCLSLTERSRTKDNESTTVQSRLANYLPWILAVGWVACVLDTFWVLVPEDSGVGAKPISEELCPEIGKLISKAEDLVADDYVNQIMEYEKRVISEANELYKKIINKNSIQDGDFFKSKGITNMIDWLEQKLPLFFVKLYVPMSKEISKTRHNLITDLLNNHTILIKAWEHNAPFIFSDINNTLSEMFSFDEKTVKDKQDLFVKFSKDLPDLFNDLQQILLDVPRT